MPLPHVTKGSSPIAQVNNRWRKTSRTVVIDAADESSLKLTQSDFESQRLPGLKFPSPLADGDQSDFLSDVDRYIMHDPQVAGADAENRHALSLSPFRMRLAQAPRSIHFDPLTTTVGIVTCGGLCPGLNDVVRGLTYMCIRTYNVKRVVGFRYGFWGLSAAGRDSAIDLDPHKVSSIHRRGGTFLGSSRGPQKPAEMVDTLIQFKVNILFTIGGDGTQRGASTIADEASKRGLDIVVMGIPKTIDNDLSFSHRTFGYETAVEHAVAAIRAAFAEASSAPHGVGIVKVMGRHSGFIAAQSSVASQQANICLIPEMPISKEVLFELLDARFGIAEHCVICVAEGFGQDWASSGSTGTDASGNKKLADIGPYLRDLISAWMKGHKDYCDGTVKLIDPSYTIRACPANTSDASFCVNLSTLAVHEAFRGTTHSIISNWYNNFIVIPTKLATSLRKVVCLRGELWRQVREVTVHIDDRSDRRMILQRQIDTLERDLMQTKAKLSKL